jgi:HlyD family secretion protein
MAAIRIQLKSTNHIPVGLFAAARIMQNERAGLLLPKTALQQDSTGDFVWTLTPENKAERLPVTVTLHGDEQVMVDGVALDARVVARAGAFIKDGDHVNAVEAK